MATGHDHTERPGSGSERVASQRHRRTAAIDRRVLQQHRRRSLRVGVSDRRRRTTSSLLRSDAGTAVPPHRTSKSVRAFDGSISRTSGSTQDESLEADGATGQGTGSTDHAYGGEEQFAFLRGAAMHRRARGDCDRTCRSKVARTCRFRPVAWRAPSSSRVAV